MGRMSKQDKQVLVPTHELSITTNGAREGVSWKVTEAAGHLILDKKEKLYLDLLRQVSRTSKTRLEVKTGYGNRVFLLTPLQGS